MRRLIAALALAGCAQPGIPPGGPPDTRPPALVRITPDSNATNVRGGSISFQFDEVVSERPQGVPSLAELFIVSPSRGANSVSWRRTRIDITPRGGLQPNTTYRVQMLPGLVDLDNNADSSGLTLVFSTGDALATGRIAGRVFDWAANRPAPRALVEAIQLPDSARYATEADSSGAFEITHMPPGEFLLRALVDQNRNAIIDTRELFDSLTITLADSFRRDMLAAIRDSLGPGVITAEVRDSTLLRLTLDRPLDTLFVLTPAHFSIRSADSAVVRVDTVLTQADIDRMAADTARTRAVEDSVRRVAVADSIRQADSVRAAQEPAAATPPRPTGRRPGAATRPPPAPTPDTSERIIPTLTARIPTTTLYLRVAERLAPNTSFRLRADSLRSVTGAVRSSERVFTTPRQRADTGQARPDTGRVRPDSGRRRDG